MKPASIPTLLLASLAFACSPKKTELKKSAEEEPPAKSEERVEAAAERVQLNTSLGEIVIELDREKAPKTVANFVNYVNQHHYDGTVFHRVINGFMIQGGGFAQAGEQLIEKKTGEPIPNEGRNGLKNRTGTIAMARTSNPDSATAQFFINVNDNVGLDYPNPDGHGYAVFGEVIKGMDVVNQIKAVRTGTKPLTMLHPATGQQQTQPSQDVPDQAVFILSARVLPERQP